MSFLGYCRWSHVNKKKEMQGLELQFAMLPPDAAKNYARHLFSLTVIQKSKDPHLPTFLLDSF